MKIIILGSGDGFSNNNTSFFVETNINILFDCGFTVPNYLTDISEDVEFLDIIYVSHAHGDHFFGLGQLLFQYWGKNRQKKLYIIGSQEVIRKIKKLTSLLIEEYDFDKKIIYLSAKTGHEINIKNNAFNFAETIHSAKNLAVRLDYQSNSLCYSGDGLPTKEAISLYDNSDLLIHEIAEDDKEKYGHCTISTVNSKFSKLDIKRLLLVHYNGVINEKEKARRGEVIVLS